MKRTILAFILMSSFVVTGTAQTATRDGSPSRRASENITADQLRDYLTFVASDEMEGRNTPSRGLDLTAKFIALQLSRWDVKPAGDNGTYFQKIALVRNQVDSSKAQAEIAGQKLNYGTDFLVTATDGIIQNAPLVFGGNGWFLKANNVDPLKDVDVRGKVVVIYSDNYPRGVTPQQLFGGGRQGVDWADPQTYAKQKGAVGLIYVGTPNIMSNWESSRSQRERGNLGVEKLRNTTGGSSLPIISLSQAAAERLFAGESSDLAKIAADYKSNAPLTAFNFSANKTISASMATKAETSWTQNVVAMIEGSDPNLKAEMVAIGAHYDHVGVNPNAPGEDKIWNGADDDGSGTVAVLGIAEALAKSQKRPKRSILFVWHAGEEKGLWGSEYFTQFPTVDLSKIVTQLNIDMIGRSKKPGYQAPCDTNPRPGRKPCNAELSGENEIYVIGSKMMSSELGNLSEAVNNSYLKLAFNYKYDDPKDPNKFFFRSDHFNYARKGVPIIFYFDGVHEDYHEPSDEVEKIDFEKMQRVTRTIFLTMWEIADSRARPVVDKQLPPELTQR